MDNTGKLKAGHPAKFFHPVLGMVDATKGLNAQQEKVLEAEGRLVRSSSTGKADKDK
ncbi:MAG: hypothetical protein K8H85_04275 [Cyclobacteriaceae bacterium]|nr:hypothetical protein [Cyclobacteriaceae bacterium]